MDAFLLASPAWVVTRKTEAWTQLSHHNTPACARATPSHPTIMFLVPPSGLTPRGCPSHEAKDPLNSAFLDGVLLPGAPHSPLPA
jgi:hypothetical protein